jgi:2-polyprenyl-6-methoxyphenol hydroxylase-like FAD-dependent oxidoreductase
LNPDGIFYNHEVESVEEKDGHVLVHFRERRKDVDATLQTIETLYALGCDGGRALANQLDIAMSGESDIVDMVTAHIRSPISRHRPDPNIFLHWFISPELGGSLKTGYLYHIGPYPMDPETEEWVFACARLSHERSRPFSKDDMLQRMQQTLKIQDLEVEILSLSHWYVNAIVAAQYRSNAGGVFLVGDAAHRIPPWGVCISHPRYVRPD